MLKTGLFRAAEVLEEMAREVRETCAHLGVSVAEMSELRRALALLNPDCLHAHMLAFEGQAISRAILAINEAAHSDPTQPGTTVLELKLGQEK